jgi:hypothetical protein
VISGLFVARRRGEKAGSAACALNHLDVKLAGAWDGSRYATRVAARRPVSVNSTAA